MKRSPMPPSKPHPSELPRNREMAFKRDGWTCRLHGVIGHECAGPLVAHHVVLRSQGGTHDVDNLVSAPLVEVRRLVGGSWGVYIDGQLISDHATHEGARRAAINHVEATR